MVVRFLRDTDAEVTVRKAAGPRARDAEPRAILSYASGNVDYVAAAQILVAALGVFKEATLQFKFSITGDGWTDHELNNPRWARYRKWRTEKGDSRRLVLAPGHQFPAEDAMDLGRWIAFAMDLGWDAELVASPGRVRLLFSHDDVIYIYRAIEWRTTAASLARLGFRDIL